MGIRLLNTAASTPVTYTFRADGIGKSRCILLRPVRRMSETVMTRVLHQDSSRHMDTVDVEKDTRRSCLLRITVHTAAWHGGAARQVRPGQAAGQRTAREARRPYGEAAALSGLFGWQGGRLAKKRPGRGCSDGKAAGWRRSGPVGAVRMARRPVGEAATRSGAGRLGVVARVDDSQVGRVRELRMSAGPEGGSDWPKGGLQIVRK